MNKKIQITNISLKKIDESITEIIYVFSANKSEYHLRYRISGFTEFDPDTYDYRIDSFVTTLLLHAMRGGYDFVSNYPISKKLYYQILWHIVSQIHRCNKDLTSLITIDAPLTEDHLGGNYVGTGISCGVDSFATIYEYTDLMPIKDYKISHLFYNKVGAHDGQIGRFDDDIETNLFHDQLAKALHVSKLLNLPLIIIESNLNEVLDRFFGFTGYEQTHTIRNIGAIYLFQQFFARYYYADAYSLDHFQLSVNTTMSKYEKWFLPLLSNERISFYSANKAMTRVEKTKLISEFPLSYDNLLVCWTHGENCGICKKCVRTLVTLDVLGCLDLYKNSFDIDAYKEKRESYILDIMNNKEDFFSKEIYDYMKSVNHPYLELDNKNINIKNRVESNPESKLFTKDKTNEEIIAGKEISDLQQTVIRYKTELDAVYASHSWRLGNILIQPFHFLKRLFEKK